MHREPEVREERVPVVEFLDGHARITSKELAPIHSVKNGIPQIACSTSPRVVVGLGKSAHTHTVRLMNSRPKGPKRMMTKCSSCVEIYTPIGLRMSRYGAAEVFIDFAEKLRHAETNPTCARIYLPR